MSENSSAQLSNPQLLRTANIRIPPQLKFIMNSIKAIVTTQLTTENHPIWKSQVQKLFTANGFEGYLDGSIPCPPAYSDLNPSLPSPDYSLWLLIDQNLAAALYSTISSSLLPYVLNLQTCKEIWTILEHRLQSTNRSRIIQLKHELDNFTMKNLTMTQYLTGIKSKVDAIAAAGVQLDPEDIIHHTLNGLSPAYQMFKTSIRSNLQPLSLDDFYALLCSEESNLAADSRRELTYQLPTPTPHALAIGFSRGRGRYTTNRGGRQSSYSTNRTTGGASKSPSITCQICNKPGHSAFKCWHRANMSYQPPPPQALIANHFPEHAEWILDSGATAHLTPNPHHLASSKPYPGDQLITTGSGHQLPIANTGHGLLPTPTQTPEPISFSSKVPPATDFTHYGYQPNNQL